MSTRARAAARAGRERVGVFGGTFDPPHFGHLALAEWARTQLALDRVVFVPAGVPPHKRGARHSSAAHRVAMTRLAVRGNPGFEVSTVEVARPGPSYTADTLRALAARWPRAHLHLLMGADMYATFASWREPRAIRALATLVVALRPGTPRPKRRPPGVEWLDNPGLEVSSTALRERALAGLGWRYLVPDAVIAHAARHRLYRGGAAAKRVKPVRNAR